MIINFEVEQETQEIETGDIVVINGNAYWIAVFNGRYTTKRIDDGYRGATGEFSTLVDLVKSFQKHNWTHYSKHKYVLKVVENPKKPSIQERDSIDDIF